MDWTTVLAGLLSGLLGAMGLGGGGVLLIYLTAFASVSQLKAQGINLLFFLPVGLLAIIIYAVKRQIKWKTVLKMWAGGAVGVGVGFLIASLIDTYWLSKAFAVFLIVFGATQIFGNKKKRSDRYDEVR